jgi:peptide/nickel transport system permease protein
MTTETVPGRPERMTAAGPPPPVKIRWNETPTMRLVADFLRRPTAVIGLIVLVAIILAAIFAPLITPQNPYDLTEIRIEHSRLPPGASGRAPPARQTLAIPIAPAEGAGEVAAEISGDAPFTAVTARWELVDDGTISIALDVTPEEGLETLADEMRLEGLPRGAEATVGSAHPFRNFWLIGPDDISAFEILRPDGFQQPFTLSIRAEQT